MTDLRIPRAALRSLTALVLVGGLASCGGGGGVMRNLFTFNPDAGKDQVPVAQRTVEDQGSTLWDLFDKKNDPNITVEVNKYIWQASLEVLNFLPIQTVDPFTGVIVTGYGTPPGGGRSYRAAVLVNDPALDARSLKLALQYSGGAAASPDTIRAVEDAILTRARQLRIRDRGL